MLLTHYRCVRETHIKGAADLSSDRFSLNNRGHARMAALVVAIAVWCLGLAQASRAEGQTGRFLGSVQSVALSVVTDAGTQSSVVDGAFMIEVGAAVGTTRPVSLSLVSLVASSVPTNSGDTGVLGFTLGSSATGQLDTTTGTLSVPVSLEVHYPLIDSAFPPVPNAPGDAATPFLETFSGTLSGNLQFHPTTGGFTFSGTLGPLVPIGQSTGNVLSVTLALTAANLPPAPAPVAGCPPGSQCIEKILKICAVRISENANDRRPAGASLTAQVNTAQEVWRQCCVKIEVKSVETIPAPGLKVLSDDVPPLSPEEASLLDKKDDQDCVEVFFVDRFDPRHANGDGLGLIDTAACKIIVADDGDATDRFLLAHEIGHCLNLRHEDGNNGIRDLMDPTGAPPPQPPGQGSPILTLDLCAKVRNPLARPDPVNPVACCKGNLLTSIATAQVTLRQNRPGRADDQFVETATFTLPGGQDIDPTKEDVTIALSEPACRGQFSRLFLPAGTFAARGRLGLIFYAKGVLVDEVTGARVTTTVRITRLGPQQFTVALDLKNGDFSCLEGPGPRKISAMLVVGDKAMVGSQCFGRADDGDLFFPLAGAVCP